MSSSGQAADENERRIPRTLFQFWHDPATLPEYARRAIQSKVMQHPDFAHVLADDASVRALIERRYGARELDLYTRNTIPASRSDIARLILLIEHGGFYVDVSWELRRTIATLVEPDTELLLVRGLFGPLLNGMLGARPRHPLLERILERALRNLEMGHFDRSVSAATGPMCLNAVVERFSLPERTRLLSLRHIGFRQTPTPSDDTSGYQSWQEQESQGIMRPKPSASTDSSPPRPTGTELAVLLESDADFLAVRRPVTAPVGEGLPSSATREYNAWLTGDPNTSWLNHLATYGPFRRVAFVTCDGGPDVNFLRTVRAETLTVYCPVAGLRRAIERDLAETAPTLRVDVVSCQVNALTMPTNAFDLVLSSLSAHRVLDLERLFRTVDRSLAERGLFALFEYVCEDGFMFSARRLAQATELARMLERALGADGGSAARPPPPDVKGPLGAARSSEILPMARAFFEPRHVATCLVASLPLLLAPHPAFVALLEASGDRLLRGLQVVCERERALLEAGEEGTVAYGVFGRRAWLDAHRGN